MPFQFTSTTPPDRFKPGMLFLGLDEYGQEIGIATDRHAIAVAGAGSGKGAALIIPNLKRWPHAALVIDPKGENAEQTWRDREAMGQAVYALDPFRVADLPDHVRARFNPLAEIDPASLTVREDIRAIADGMVLRPNAKDSEWYDGAVSVLAGFIAHAVSQYGPETRRLAVIRDMLNAADGPPGQDADGHPTPSPFQALVAEMAENPACGGLAQSAAALISGGSKTGREFLSGARRAIDSFGTDALREMMAESSFRLSDLKGGNCTVFLILPPHYLREHARFLRLFVRLALNTMAKGGNRKGGKCLFILDEFFSLGRIDEIATAAGLMRSYGVQLWPFLQDLGQLLTLYDREGADTFFGNADARIFFGNSDQTTLAAVSDWLGRVTPDEARPDGPPPRSHDPTSPDEYEAAYRPASGPFTLPAVGRAAGKMAVLNTGIGAFHAVAQSGRTAEQLALRNTIEERRRAQEIADANARAAYDHDMRVVGAPRLTPDEIAALTGKGPGDAVARSMIAFGPAGKVFHLKLAPYFLPPPDPAKIPDPDAVPPEIERIYVEFQAAQKEQDRAPAVREKQKTKAHLLALAAAFGLCVLAANTATQTDSWSVIIWGGFVVWLLWFWMCGRADQTYTATIKVANVTIQRHGAVLQAYLDGKKRHRG
ncbi:type IV secretory system conjugative DNA transfer family protein [Roseomonas mucosa]|uniref:type IV secretory system conjugative DNA transfer family protein n=1 Tax=Roseomonas mucosa TaxID=207340 RepID=UPI001D59EE55|nr:type IV secretory system conjugative DNA transfer family protein [Roseomonas mucosa]MBS5905133.1 type IV secretory system conjugative DNA transfer family protein [Acetobacteraceae bacterium]MDT8291992.1 type IV secretory system conjugative DNA transfer family protein [Roseomonas mucosa]MDT8352433.1 type IV secretory system conjugative DNA transfer family protein [Roseomonas mucosa]